MGRFREYLGKPYLPRVIIPIQKTLCSILSGSNLPPPPTRLRVSPLSDVMAKENTSSAEQKPRRFAALIRSSGQERAPSLIAALRRPTNGEHFADREREREWMWGTMYNADRLHRKGDLVLPCGRETGVMHAVSGPCALFGLRKWYISTSTTCPPLVLAPQRAKWTCPIRPYGTRYCEDSYQFFAEFITSSRPTIVLFPLGIETKRFMAHRVFFQETFPANLMRLLLIRPTMSGIAFLDLRVATSLSCATGSLVFTIDQSGDNLSTSPPGEKHAAKRGECRRLHGIAQNGAKCVSDMSEYLSPIIDCYHTRQLAAQPKGNILQHAIANQT
ncbi:hypothetical protein PR048_006341 [Dryococelus australis]|uniref:Uncharacterized protein n=1 Tax=Dryococelus australis TaxID=614101 RepID=A0ABQ9IAR4_9NEOP|nr:hypothetical protein PR048_006341 [Dryococelus australis]